MADLSEFPNTGPYSEADYYQHAHYPQNFYPCPTSNQQKMEQFEILPSIDIFTEHVQPSPAVFEHTWFGQNAYKEFSPSPTDSSYPVYQVDTSNMEKLNDANSFSVWRPSMQLNQPLTNEFMACQMQSMQNFPMYEQSNPSNFGIRLQSPGVGLVCHVPQSSEPSPTTTLDYKPVYTHSPSIADSQALQLTAYNLNAQNDINEFGDFFASPLNFHGNSESSSAGTPQTSSSPVTNTPVDKKSFLRLTRNGKVAKKVTQNCHANSQCSNCKTVNTTLWRRNASGEVECNACNLYYRKNGTRRPPKLQKRGIMRRTRNPRMPYGNDPTYIQIPISP